MRGRRRAAAARAAHDGRREVIVVIPFGQRVGALAARAAARTVAAEVLRHVERPAVAWAEVAASALGPERRQGHLGVGERAGRLDGHHASAVAELPGQMLRLSRPHGHLEKHRPVIHEGPKGHGRGRRHTPHLVTHEGRERAAGLEDAVERDAHRDGKVEAAAPKHVGRHV